MAVPNLKAVDQFRHPGVKVRRQMVKVSDLRVDPNYQRGVSQPRVQAMGKNWDPLLAEEIKVSQRSDGSLWLIDGQHRMAGALLAGVPELYAMVLTGLTREQEADLFVRGTKQRKGFNSLEEWKAGLASGYPDVVAINAVVEKLGGRVNVSPNAGKGINAPAALSDIYRLGGIELLEWTLETIRDAWGDLDGQHVASYVIKGLGLFLGMYADLLDHERLVRQMNRATIVDVARRSNAYRGHRGHWGETRVSAIYYAFADIYNYNLRDTQALPDRRPNRRDVVALDTIHGGGAPTQFNEYRNPKSMERASGLDTE